MKNLPKIQYKSIPHKMQRYDTCGDYFEDADIIQFRCSKMNAEMEFLVLIHELVEWILIAKKGIEIDDIDEFDISFEENRKPGNLDEPGDDPDAPYYDEHQFATAIERLMCDKLGIRWRDYEKVVNELEY